jgi:hypothetical protein
VARASLNSRGVVQRRLSLFFFLLLRAWRPSIVDKAGDRWHRSGSPCGSLHDQILASLESAFGRDRGPHVVAGLLWRLGRLQ